VNRGKTQTGFVETNAAREKAREGSRAFAVVREKPLRGDWR
jgi:hypothetical protein